MPYLALAVYYRTEEIPNPFGAAKVGASRFLDPSAAVLVASRGHRATRVAAEGEERVSGRLVTSPAANGTW